MTEPDIFDGLDTEEDATPSPETSRSVSENENAKQDEGPDEVTLKCPHSMTSLSHPDGLFPTVTRAGTKMTREQAGHAKAAAKAARKKLITVGGRNR